MKLRSVASLLAAGIAVSVAVAAFQAVSKVASVMPSPPFSGRIHVICASLP